MRIILKKCALQPSRAALCEKKARLIHERPYWKAVQEIIASLVHKRPNWEAVWEIMTNFGYNRHIRKAV